MNDKTETHPHRKERVMQRTLKIGTVFVLAFGMLVALTIPASAASVRWTDYGRHVSVTFTKAETARIANASHTGFMAGASSLCGTLPGGKKFLPVKSACVVGVASQYGRLGPMFRRAADQDMCMKVSWPPLFPIPTAHAPHSKPVKC